MNRIKNILQEVDKEEHKREKRSLKRLQKSAKKFENARRVGKNKFEDTEVQFSQISELAGSLRELIPQGNILRDKFRNMQKRNLIEVTKPQFKYVTFLKTFWYILKVCSKCKYYVFVCY